MTKAWAIINKPRAKTVKPYVVLWDKEFIAWPICVFYTEKEAVACLKVWQERGHKQTKIIPCVLTPLRKEKKR